MNHASVMKSKLPCLIVNFALLALCPLALSTAHAQGTAFTYSGQLNSGGAPAPNGLYDFQFALSNAPSGGSQVAQHRYEAGRPGDQRPVHDEH